MWLLYSILFYCLKLKLDAKTSHPVSAEQTDTQFYLQSRAAKVTLTWHTAKSTCLTGREGSAQLAGVVTETLHTEETRWLDVIQQLVHSQCEGCIELWSRDTSTTRLEYSGINPPTLQQPAPPPEPQPPKTPKDQHCLTMPTWSWSKLMVIIICSFSYIVFKNYIL